MPSAYVTCNPRKLVNVPSSLVLSDALNAAWLHGCGMYGQNGIATDGHRRLQDNQGGRPSFLGIALGRPAGQRVAAVTNLMQTAKMNGHDPYAQMRDVMAGLPVQRAHVKLP